MADAGVVEENVESAEFRFGGFDHPGAVLVSGYVRLHSHYPSSPRLDLPHRIGQGRGVDIHRHHRGVLCREQECRSAADAGSRPGNERHFARQSHVLEVIRL